MKFIADLHIHSRFSRATAKNLDFENLYMAARLKGITVVGTGDFTHPAWIAEIQEKLIPAEPGLFKLKDELEKQCEKQLPFSDPAPIRFMLSCEISNIYKKSGATRKNHNLVFLPDIQSALRFNAKLDQIGNIKSDGRPILGLDARNLLELLIETSDEGFLIPAHIWTPWFSLFGSKSGFDAIEECFEDLTPHIFAVETGLSSDPAMNWRVKNIDGLTLVSNSDAHSPANLGREANLLHTALSYPAIKDTLKTGDPDRFLGTIEFFPQEGKYHNDGHRKCDVNIPPEKSIQYNDICPECGKPMTLGVLHRVAELATRSTGKKPEKTHPFFHVIPLAEIISEIVGTGPKSKKVGLQYKKAIETLGPELKILHDMPIENIKTSPVPFLGEAIDRMRAGRVHIIPGYDGEYGRIKIFSPEEKDRLSGQKSLFNLPCPKPAKKKTAKKGSSSLTKKKTTSSKEQTELPVKRARVSAKSADSDILTGLNENQSKAVRHPKGPLMIVAGPGTGKTRTLTCRIAYLIKTGTVFPDNILAVTFTNKAANEMAGRLRDMLDKNTALPLTATFHAFCLRLLKEVDREANYTVIDDYDRNALIAEAVHRVRQDGMKIHEKPALFFEKIISAKQHLLNPSDNLAPISGELDVKRLTTVYETYQHLLDVQHLYDYEDLILKTVERLETDADTKKQFRNRFTHIFVDEYQDLNYGQYRIIKALAPPDGNLCVIGDPDQSIYGFRGSDVAYFQKFADDFPAAVQIHLTQNYRSAETILEASYQVIEKYTLNTSSPRVYSGIKGPRAVSVIEAESEKSEAVAVGKTIEQFIGGTGFQFDDFGKKTDATHGEDRAFSDFAVLFRTRAQGDVFAKMFDSAGIPYQMATKESAFCKAGIAELISLLKIIEGYGAYIDFEQTNAIIDHGMAKQDFEALKSWGYANRYPLGGLMAEAQRLPIEKMSKSGRLRLDVILKFIDGYAKQTVEMNVRDKLRHLAKQLDIEKKLNSNVNIAKAFDYVTGVAESFGHDTAGFLETAVLQGDSDVLDVTAQKVALLTIHAAKGLEFPVVFIAGCENGFIPFIRKNSNTIDIDEERRLFYVAMTRAKDQLFFTRSKTRIIFGKMENRQQSPFVASVKDWLLEKATPQPKKRKKSQVQLTLFS